MESPEDIKFVFVVTSTSLFGMQKFHSFTDDKQIASTLCVVDVWAMMWCQEVYIFYCVKYPYLILTSAYVLAGAYMDDQTRILFLKTNILVGTSMYAHDCACAYTGITPISLTFNLVVRECTS